MTGQGLLDAHRNDGKRYVVRADEKMTAFLELEASLLTEQGQQPKSLGPRNPRLTGNPNSNPAFLRLSAMISQYFI
jgi:hypothetical protein